jgi:formylglycine-generating enzyme required for sulfatase activity
MGRLRSRTGFSSQVDLPTEAQWEHAFRANTSGGSCTNATDFTGLGRYNGNRSSDDKTGNVDPDVGGTMYVGSYPPNPRGLYDMFGNVLELCLDRYLAAPGGVKPNVEQVDPWGPGDDETSSGNSRVARGGCWDIGDSFRLHYWRRNFSSHSNYLGFRTVVNCR